MMDASHLAAARTFRTADPGQYPELAGYSVDQIYKDTIGGGALYLAARIARPMDLQPGQIVLDMGCGHGTTSVFLARCFGVRVVAVDLWTPIDSACRKIEENDLRDRITPLHLDMREPLPFPAGYFDAVFCMNSLSFYGGSVEFLRRLLTHVKPGGVLSVGMETLGEEMSPEERRNPPAVYNWLLPDGTNVWDADFSKMQWPGFWKSLFEDTGMLDVLDCREVEDAAVLYEDMVLHQIARGDDPHDIGLYIDQILFSRESRPRMTLFTISARKR
jgi:SAM-dependent methyltransferase